MFAALIRQRATVYLAVVCILVFGLVTYKSLPREAQPDVNIPFVMVTTVYQGVSPEDIESLVTIPIENELSGIADLKKMTSTSSNSSLTWTSRTCCRRCEIAWAAPIPSYPRRPKTRRSVRSR